ncbi:MAG: Tm-1-like ATP-binding domain-containing protein, partial [Chloroflexota bacterium]|nr:Tm-1-like ATP-binding domain-containing protein [Chloroflexota bacterium]
MATVVLLGTLDTKGAEYAWLRERIEAAGCEVVLVDAGVLNEPRTTPDVTREEVAGLAGTTIAELVAAGDRGAAVATMGEGAAQIVTRLHEEGRLHGILALGGSGGTSLATRAMQALAV